MNIRKAKLFVSLTNDDVINLDTYEKLKFDVPCLIQINDIYLRGVLEKHIGMNNKNVINSYNIAAEFILNKILSGNSNLSDIHYLFIIGGYGNFGKMMSKQITNKFTTLDNYLINVIDIKDDRKSEIEMFKSIETIEDGKIIFLKRDIRDLTTWEQIYNSKENEGKKIIAILSTDNDAINISTTLSIAKISKQYNVDLKIMTRFFRNVEFLKDEKIKQSEGLESIEPFVFSEIVIPKIISSMEEQLGI